MNLIIWPLSALALALALTTIVDYVLYEMPSNSLHRGILHVGCFVSKRWRKTRRLMEAYSASPRTILKTLTTKGNNQ